MPLATDLLDRSWAPVSIERTDAGLVEVRPLGAERIPPHVGSAIDLAGGTLVVDARPNREAERAPTAGDVPPTAYIFNSSLTGSWLSQLYGEAVAEQVMRIAASPEPGASTTDASRGTLSSPLIRLGQATWVHRWWPSGNPALHVRFPVELLELEIGALRWLAEDAFGDTSVAEQLLSPHLEVLLSCYDWNRYEQRGQGQAVVDDVLTTALRGVVDVVADSTPRFEDCLELLDAIDTGAQLRPDDWRRFDELLEASRSDLVLNRGSDSHSVQRGEASGWRRTTYDPRDVPPRTLSDVEDNIAWSVESADARRRIIVAAIAAPTLRAKPTGTPLMARVFVAGSPIVFPLEWTPSKSGAEFRGSAFLPNGITMSVDDIQIGVFHPAWAGPARSEWPAVDRAAQERAEITAMLLNRLTGVGERLARTAVQADPSSRPTAAEIVAKFSDRNGTTGS
jgi:hypothetical protein